MTKDDLEQMIDKIGLGGVLEMISEICHEKADHIASSYDDRTTAKIWQKAGKKIAAIEVEVYSP